MLTATDIEVAISSAQVTGAVGTLILLLLGLIGWLVRAEWQSVNLRLASIEINTSDLPALKERVTRLEAEGALLRSRQHRIANFVNTMQGKFTKDELGVLDLERED